MLRHSFSVNSKFTLDGASYTIRSITDDTQLLLEEKPNNFRNVELTELLDAYSDGRLFLGSGNNKQDQTRNNQAAPISRRLLSDFSPLVREKSKRARHYLDHLEKDGPIRIDRHGVIEDRIAAVAETLGDPHPPHKTTVFRWLRKRDRAGGNPDALIYRFEDCGGKGKRRCTPAVAAAEDRLINDIYMKENGPPVEDVADQMRLDFERENLWKIDSEKLIPRSVSSVTRRIAQLDPYDVVAARRGAKEASRRFQANGKVPTVKNLLEIVEIDHTPLDLFVINTIKRMPMGRPTLTMAICRKSKMPWGMHIGFDDCSTDAVLSCIAHGIKPKTYIRKHYPNIKGDWPVFGIPTDIRCDNGNEFHARSLEAAADDLKFGITFCPKRKPNWKGSIESFLKTINYNFAHRLPGTSFAKYWKRGDYDPLKAAVIDLEDLLRLLHTWLIDVYMRDMHRSLGKSPINAWKEGLK